MLNSLDLNGRPQDTRIVVAMSGGVDLSATAALLKSEGYDVVGITLQLYDHGAATHRKGACCAGQDIHDARNVAEQIGIPHYVLDYEDRFRESVIDNFAASYVSGETPVPCIECNRSIKFRDLLKTARELGAAALATGHYVASHRMADGSRALFCAADFRPRPELFPVCDHPRAARLSALSARRHDQATGPRAGATFRSCRGRQARQPGHLLRADRALHRYHRPAAAERHRARRHRRPRRAASSAAIRASFISPSAKGAASASPPVHRFMCCGSTPKAAASWSGRARRCGWTGSLLRDINWIGDGALERAIGEGLEIFVRVRSSRAAQPAWLRPAGRGHEIELVAGEEGVSPGQACVFYDAASGQARVLGGGFIQSATAKDAAPGARWPLVAAMRG